MQFTTTTFIAILAASVAAAPVESTVEYIPGHLAPGHATLATRSDEILHKRLGPLSIALMGGGLSGTISGIVSSFLQNRNRNRRPRRDIPAEVDAEVAAIDAKPVSDWTFEDACESFANNAVNDLYKVGNDEAAICTSVAYMVNHPGMTREAASVQLEADGRTADFDCFLLAGPSTFTVVGPVNASTVAIKTTKGMFVNGTLTI